MMRLRVKETDFDETGHIHFNSTMVRLRGGLVLRLAGLVFPFQFHYGAIKSFPCSIHNTQN